MKHTAEELAEIKERKRLKKETKKRKGISWQNWHKSLWGKFL